MADAEFSPTDLELMDLDDHDNSTWASRNPSKAIIPPRNNYKKLTDAQKITASVRLAQTREKQLQLTEDLGEFKITQARLLQEIAEKHGKSLDYVKGRATAASTFKTPRALNLHNAKLHFLSLEINNGFEEGERKNLMEIQHRLKDDPDMCELDKREEDRLLQILQDHKNVQKAGARANHRAAAADYEKTVGRIHEEMGKLHERTGATLFLLGAHDHVDDTLPPTFVDAGNTEAFFLEHIDMTANEFTRKFNSWCESRRNGSKAQGSTLRLLQIECRCLISEGLNRILKRKNVMMAYDQYEAKIMVEHKVQLRGWPENVAWGTPHNLTTIAAVRKLRDALVSGACAWVKLSSQEHEAIVKKVEQAPPKKRKTRSDKGTKKITSDTSKTTDGPRKRARKAKKATSSQVPPIRSPSVVPSSDEEDDNA
ncbi:hypothetical protein DFP72DRAFT_1077152 [Ephemerocybe angulata]|uniref:Uncharacterized protein n=1 Tax=Ephemerocybe angulata TaxID=980116 RepID=A0A8H6HEW7_9AGAR|nr:hypothetical protein DFP72DRAFT_1077152 [Tulosesus angulatus]